MPEDWQIGFKVKGLIAPEKEIVFGDYILVRGIPPSDDAYVFFKVAIQNEQERDKLRPNFMNVLRNIAQIYGLVTKEYVEVLSSSVEARISSETPFGHTGKLVPGGATLVPVFKDDERRKGVPPLEKTIAKYESVKNVFEDRKKSYLRNAIDYFYHALGDIRYEERLIDLMIAMESLFSKELQELGLRISLRAAFLLSIGRESKRPNIFRLMRALYKKRSKVVHGVERVDLSYFEISMLESYVQESIKRLIHIEQEKENFLELLDQSVYDENKRRELEELVSESLSHWET